MIWDKIVGEFVDVIEWTDDSSDTMLWRFERHGNEIKYGAQLTVRESQIAVFVNEGRVADVFEPGMYTLETANLPIISTMENWHHGFQSPFKAEIYFVNTKRFTDLKWGTKHPVTLRDPEFGPVRLRAFGTYVTKIKDPVVFIREIAGTDGHFTTDEITDQLRNMIVSRFSSVMADSGIPVLDLAANFEKLGTFLTNKIMPEFDPLRPRAHADDGREHFAPGCRRRGAGSAHQHGRGRRSRQIHPVSDGRVHRQGRREPGRCRGCRRRHRRRHRHG